MKQRQKLIEVLLLVLLILSIVAVIVVAYLFLSCQLATFLPVGCP